MAVTTFLVSSFFNRNLHVSKRLPSSSEVLPLTKACPKLTPTLLRRGETPLETCKFRLKNEETKKICCSN